MQLVDALVALGLTSVTLVGACATQTEADLGSAPPGQPFAAVAEAGADGEGGLVSYCPTSNCPPGWTTCPSSRFPCDVNIWTDVNNCGGCGMACPPGRFGFEVFACVEGACKVTCGILCADCDGLLDNGCETTVTNDDHCGSCEKKCTDPEKPCLEVGPERYDCGCPPGKTHCGFSCIDVANNDGSCGACYVPCDETGGGAPIYPHTYYGCLDSQCDRKKCEPGYADCDEIEPTGCETHLVSDANCGACGNACPPGQACRLDEYYQPTCMCPEGTAFCESFCYEGVCVGKCVDLTSDLRNCGACDVACANPISVGAQGECNYGTCMMICKDGRADCNNSQTDGCEVNTHSDPRNCGECGHTCDAVAGQACVGGRCVLEPCDGGAGSVTQ